MGHSSVTQTPLWQRWGEEEIIVAHGSDLGATVDVSITSMIPIRTAVSVAVASSVIVSSMKDVMVEVTLEVSLCFLW